MKVIHSFVCFFFVSVNETLDDMLEDSGDEEETNGIVNQVLDEIGIEISGKVINSHELILECFTKLNIFPLFIQMSDAPSAIKDSIGTSSKMTEKDIEAQLAKLRST